MSKLTTYLSILFSFVSLMLTGCEQNTSEVLPPQGEELTEVLFSARIANVQVSTRAAKYDEKSSFASGDEIGLFGWKTSLTDENQYLGNIKLVSDEGGHSLTASGQKIYFPVQAQTLQLTAYYPYSADVNENRVLIQSEIEESITGIKDPLWGITTVNKPASEGSQAIASFNLTHRMARLKIYVYKDSGEAVDYKLSRIGIEFYNRQIGTMDVKTGKVAALSTTHTSYIESYTVNNELTTDTHGTPQFDHTILPAEAVEGLSTVKKITIDVLPVDAGANPENTTYVIYDAEVQGSTLSIKPNNGSVTRINVKFNPSMVSSASMTPWGSEEELDI